MAIALMLLLATLNAPDDGPGPTVRVLLANGDVLHGTIVMRTDEHVVLDHPDLGRLLLPAGSVAPPPAVVEASLPPAPEPPADPWSGSLDFGLDGEDGDSERTALRTEVRARRETDERQLDLLANFRYANEDRNATTNRLFVESRHQWFQPGTPWSTFLQGSVETDRFAEFDERLATAGGVGYAFVDTDERKIVGRTGVGMSREFGGPDDDVTPELLLGADFERTIDERHSWTATLELFPNLRESGEFRALGRASWDVKMSEEEPWLLRVGLEADHDSQPGTAEATDLNYFLSLGYGF